MALNRDEVVRYAAPFVRGDSGSRAWLVVPGEIRSSGASRNGSSVYVFKDGLPHVVEGVEAVARLKTLSPETR
jgi:hypothetical protein